MFQLERTLGPDRLPDRLHHLRLIVRVTAAVSSPSVSVNDSQNVLFAIQSVIMKWLRGSNPITPAEAATPLSFWVYVDPEHYLQLDDVVHVRSLLPGGDAIDVYGVVDEVRAQHEGVTFHSDVALATDGVLPVQAAVSAHISVTRVEPEIFVPPQPGTEVHRAHGDARDAALFFDGMKTRVPFGSSRDGEAVFANMEFLDGTRGAHVNISGISGVATKTSYAMFLLHALFEGGALGMEIGRAHV